MIDHFSLLAKNWVKSFLYPRPLIGLLYLPRFIGHMSKYRTLAKDQKISFSDMSPCLGDWSEYTPFDAHYFYQAAWLARRLADFSPVQHVDVGSSVSLIAIASAIVNTVFIDLRPLPVSLRNLFPVAGDILALPLADDSIKSLSCLHVIEHIGLGRYGDPIDPRGTLKAARELQRALCPGGRLFLSLPVGRERICFNAHRIYSVRSVLEIFSELNQIEYSYVDDRGNFHEYQSSVTASDMEYGCGLFIFEKPPI